MIIVEGLGFRVQDFCRAEFKARGAARNLDQPLADVGNNRMPRVLGPNQIRLLGIEYI